MTPIIKRLELAEAALAKNGFVLVDDVWVAPPVQQPTGEQLYDMVTSGFTQGRFPWVVVRDSGKAAWGEAAADLVFAPDTIMAKYAK